MSKLPDPPPGELVEISGRPLSFSYWPTGRNKRRYGLRPHVFATNPWPLLTRSVREHCPKTSVPAALAFLEQAEDFYNAAHLGRVAAAKPVLLYYSFLNAVKAYILTSGRRTELDSAKHGLSEKKLAPGRKELIDAVLDAHPSSATTTNIFDDLLTIVQSTGLTSVVTIPLSALMPQIVPGHRLWASASGNVERFVAIESINFVHHQPDKELWLRLLINSGDLTRLGISHKKFLETTRMGSDWYEVKCADMKGNHKLVRFDQSNGIIYTHRAADRIQDAVGTIQHLLWRTDRKSVV